MHNGPWEAGSFTCSSSSALKGPPNIFTSLLSHNSALQSFLRVMMCHYLYLDSFPLTIIQHSTCWKAIFPNYDIGMYSVIRYQKIQQSMFLCAEYNSCPAVLAEQWDVSDIWDIIHHSTSDISSVWSKQVRCYGRKRLVTEITLLLIQIYIKPLQFT